MKRNTYEQLARLSSETGKEYGKLVQKLLAAAFLETDVQKLVERAIQGIDLEFEIAGERHVLEIKTSQSNAIRLGAKDLQGLDRYIEDGAKVYIAVLTTGPFEDWVLARYTPGEFPVAKDQSSFAFRAYRDRALEERIAGAFDRVVDEHTHTAITRRQSGLDEVLQKYPAWGRA